MRRSVILLGMLLATQLVAGSRAWAWDYLRSGPQASAVAIDPAGNVISGGFLFDEAGGLDSVVVKHAGADGTPLWKYVLSKGGPTYQASVSFALDPGGPIIAASFQRHRYREYIGAVAKLSPDGAELWRFDPAEFIGLRTIAVDPAGDVIAAGSISEFEPTDHDLIVLKLSGASGEELWRHVLPGVHDNVFDRVSSVVVDAAGDVFAGGAISEQVVGQQDFLVFKLSGAQGSLLWRREIAAASTHGGEALALALAPDGDVVAAGHAVLVNWCDFLVARFAGEDGTELWRSLAGGAGCDIAYALAVNDNGDAFATGNLDNGFSVLKLAGSSGSLLWRHDIPHLGTCGGGGCGGGKSLALDGNDIVVAGTISGPGDQGDLVIARLASADGSRRWLRLIDHKGCGDGAARLTVKPDGIGVAGQSYDQVDGECAWPQAPLYAVRKLGSASGKDFWGGCADELDNDDDGAIDFPGDAGCKETKSPVENPACDDGIDNDNDGATDLADPACDARFRTTEAPQCQDGIDNDGWRGTDFDGGEFLLGVGNGDPDGADPQCAGKPWRNNEQRCGLGFELTLVLVPLRWWRRRRAVILTATH